MKIVLKMLTVTFNIPKNMPRMKIYLNGFLVSIFIASTTSQDCPRPDRSVRDRYKVPKAGLSDMRPDHPTCSRDKLAHGPDHPT